MAKKEWDDFIDEHPAGHLVVGIVGPKEIGLKAVDRPKQLVERLLEVLAIGGDYAVAGMADGPDLAVHCAFAREADAARLATAVQATVVSRYPGWRSQRHFLLGPSIQKAIDTVLKTIK